MPLSAEFNIFFSIRTKNNPRPCYSSIAMAHAQAIYFKNIHSMALSIKMFEILRPYVMTDMHCSAETSLKYTKHVEAFKNDQLYIDS